MRWKILTAAVAGALALGVAGCMSGGDGEAIIKPASMVLTNGKVMTMDGKSTLAQAVAIRGNRIVAVGSDTEIARYIGPDTQVIALNGKTLLPGFIDSHMHPVGGGERLGQCSVDGEPLPVAEIVAHAVNDCLPVEINPAPGKWIQVVNVNPANFVATAADLDRISTTRPVILAGIDGHTSWLNTAGLKLARITAATPDPVGGQIERDASGQPTGFLKDAAQGLARATIPELSLAERMTQTQQALELASSKGITSLQDALASPEVMEVYEALEQNKQLNMRIRASLSSEILDSEAEYQRLAAIRSRFSGHSLVRADAVKIFSDGVIEYPTQTAAMIKPYLDGNGKATANYGGRYFDQEVLNRYVARLDKDGFTVHAHSIGDFTTHAVLDAFQYARDKNGVTDNRHQIAHLQVVDPGDFARFVKLGVIANMQLYWAIPDEYTMDSVQPFIAPEVHRYMYPVGSLKAAGATIAGGSDWPVDASPGDPMPNTPLAATQTALTRQNPDPSSPHFGNILHPEERVDLNTMLAAYTINAAKALRQDTTTGSIEVGKLADLVVLDADLNNTAVEKLTEVRPLYTILNGTVVYQAQAQAQAQSMKEKSRQAVTTSTPVLNTLKRQRSADAHKH